MTTQDPRAAALEFLKQENTGMLATLAVSGAPRVRPIHYVVDESFNVFFITLANTGKVQEIKRDPRASFVVIDKDVPKELQIEGEVTDITETATIDDTVAELARVLFSDAPYYAPITRFDPSTVLMFKLTPHSVRLGDFTKGQGTDELFTTITP